MKFLLSISFSAIPILIYLFILRWLDKYDREPLKFVLIHFLWGMIGAIVLTFIIGSIVESTLSKKIKDEYSLLFISSTFTAPLIEETVKGIFILFTFTKLKFDNSTDSIVYGGTIGLGFGLTENLTYFFEYTESISELIDLALIRNIFSVGIHFSTSAILGSALAFSKFKPFKSKLAYFVIGLFLAVSIHSIFNQTILSDDAHFAGYIFSTVIIVLIYFLMNFSLNMEENILYYEMNDEISQGNLKPEYATVISDYKERNTKGWIRESIRKKYITLATTLAFRKNQIRKTSSQKMRKIYEKEIEDIRNQLKHLEISSNE